MQNRLPPISQIRWLRFMNTSTTDTIPSFGVFSSGGVDTAGVIQAQNVPSDGAFVYVNGPVSCPPSGAYQGQESFGVCSKDSPIFAAYDPATGTPATGDTWGSKAGHYTLAKGNQGFIVEGGATNNRVMVRRDSGGGLGQTYVTLNNATAVQTNLYDAELQTATLNQLGFTDGGKVWAYAPMGLKLSTGCFYDASFNGSFTANGETSARPLYFCIGGWDFGPGTCSGNGMTLGTY